MIEKRLMDEVDGMRQDLVAVFGRNSRQMLEADGWKYWFAWYPVRLLTLEWAWFRPVMWREADKPSQWSYHGNDYCNP